MIHIIPNSSPLVTIVRFWDLGKGEIEAQRQPILAWTVATGEGIKTHTATPVLCDPPTSHETWCIEYAAAEAGNELWIFPGDRSCTTWDAALALARDRLIASLQPKQRRQQTPPHGKEQARAQGVDREAQDEEAPGPSRRD